MSNSRDKLDSLYVILRGMIREEIDQTPGFRELTGRSALPANVHAESTILGAILLDNAAHTEAAEKLESDDFSLDSHRRIFLCMTELMNGQRAVDIVTLSNQLGENGCKEIGGVAYFAGLTEGLPRLPRVSEYIAIVQEKAKLRRIMGACVEAIRTAEEQQVPAAEIVSQLGVALKGIKKSNGK